jgi:hypothetical protein
MKAFCLLALIALSAAVDLTYFHGKYVNVLHTQLAYLLRGY